MNEEYVEGPLSPQERLNFNSFVGKINQVLPNSLSVTYWMEIMAGKSHELDTGFISTNTLADYRLLLRACQETLERQNSGWATDRYAHEKAHYDKLMEILAKSGRKLDSLSFCVVPLQNQGRYAQTATFLRFKPMDTFTKDEYREILLAPPDSAFSDQKLLENLDDLEREGVFRQEE